MRDSAWRLLLTHCLLCCQVELQWSCCQHEMSSGAEGFQLCGCRLYPPPLPPPPPPPPPPPGLPSPAAVAPAVLCAPWWTELLVLGSTGSALTAVLLLTLIYCYKAIRRKPLMKETAEVSISIRTSSSAVV
ncbi:proline-rich membrane anchor 1-like [Danio aesculapii]|uniref:proline-rich membrane anchor 1-like n=1 Tax=Danio aesculapii TaxID=1142201 RepID=UPI0024C0BBF1|nr:proline-rich membrane anchor 1-like [Danio aesculapii]